MIRPLLIAALMAAAPTASAVTIVIRPVIVIVRPSVTVAPVAHPTVTPPAQHKSEPDPVTRVVTPAVTPAPLTLPTYTLPIAGDGCGNERQMRGDCYTM